MHRVRLRDYLNSIDRLIDENRLHEAGSHCLHVLRQYPLHLDTYRLYGRVLLEQQKFTSAIDIFQRVISADPEDLIAHAGLALAYKENLNLPAAVWYMERAFELDPYNKAIRAELTELYAARDGYTLDQIELTQPALARLYFRGALYREAAAELTAILNKQPKRHDLKLLLADALYWGDRRADLIDVCLEIVGFMPYSVKANAILAAEWMRNKRPTEANEHWRRVQALTLLTGSTVDPESTLGQVTIESEDLTLPEEVVVDQLDDIAAASQVGDREADWTTEIEDVSEDIETPGWLQEIGFSEPDVEVDDFIDDDSSEQYETTDQSLDIDWEDLAIAVSAENAIEESLTEENATSDPILADQIDDIADAPQMSDQEADWTTETEDIGEEVEAPGWLQEIGFLDSDMAIDDVIDDESSEYEEITEPTLDMDWEKLAIAVGAETAIEEFQIEEEEDIASDPLVDNMLAMVDEVETTAHDQTIADSLEALSDLEVDIYEDPKLEQQKFSAQTMPLLPELEDNSEELLTAMPQTEPSLAVDIGEEPVDWTEALDDLSELVDELEGYREGTTTILPPLESVEKSEDVGHDWMDELADDAEVEENLPEWLYEAVGLQDESIESAADEGALESGDSDSQVTRTPIDEAIDDLDTTLAGETPIDEIDSAYSMLEDIPQNLESTDILDGDADTEDDLPDWLMSADNVLEELPEEVLKSSDDSWLEEMKIDEEPTAWLEEIDAAPVEGFDEEFSSSSTGMTGFLSKGLGLENSQDAFEPSEGESKVSDENLTATDAEEE